MFRASTSQITALTSKNANLSRSISFIPSNLSPNFRSCWRADCNLKFNLPTYGNVQVKINDNVVSINTDRLKLISLNQFSKDKQIRLYKILFGNPGNTTLFRNGKPWDDEAIIEFTRAQAASWNAGNYYSAFTVFLQSETFYNKLFIGTLNLYHYTETYSKLGAGHANVVEMGYAIDASQWGKGYGTELATLAKEYVTRMAYLSQEHLTSSQPKEIVATVHPDNIASCKILNKVLGKSEPEIMNRFNHQPRLFYYCPLSLPKKSDSEYSNITYKDSITEKFGIR